MTLGDGCFQLERLVEKGKIAAKKAYADWNRTGNSRHRCQIRNGTMFCAFWMLCVVPLPVDEEEIAKLLSQSSNIEERLVVRLNDPDIWKDASQKKVLLRYLKIARFLKPAELADVLAEHIDDEPSRVRFESPTPPLSVTYPAYGVLLEIGPRSTPALLGVLKTVDPTANVKQNRRKRELAADCIVSIYKAGGFGKEMARARIEFELKKVTGKQRALLQESLKDKSLAD